MNLVEVEKLAKKLMAEHLDNTWSFKWGNSLRAFGTCTYHRRNGVLHSGTIKLSKKLCSLNDEVQVRDTILHEIAHALTPGDGHGYKWKMACIKIGAKPERCYTTKDVEVPKMKYFAICGGCNVEHQKTRMTALSLRRQSCCKCQGGKPWDERIILQYQARY